METGAKPEKQPTKYQLDKLKQSTREVWCGQMHDTVEEAIVHAEMNLGTYKGGGKIARTWTRIGGRRSTTTPSLRAGSFLTTSGTGSITIPNTPSTMLRWQRGRARRNSKDPRAFT